MNLFQWCGIAIFVSILLWMMRRIAPDFKGALSVGSGLLFFLSAMLLLQPFLEYIRELSIISQTQEELSFLMRLFALCALLRWACSVCKDLGEEQLADQLSFLGKAEMLCLSLPCFRSLMDLALGLLV